MGAFDGAALLLGVGDVTQARMPDDPLAAASLAWERPARPVSEMGCFDGPRTMLPLGADHRSEPGAYAGLVGDSLSALAGAPLWPRLPARLAGPPPT